jgi:hypothetical protein
VTQALIFCSQCRESISNNNGPRQDAWCIKCTDEKVATDAAAKIAARKKAAADALAKKKADAEEKAKQKPEDDTGKHYE